jgi:hypothetical protein
MKRNAFKNIKKQTNVDSNAQSLSFKLSDFMLRLNSSSGSSLAFARNLLKSTFCLKRLTSAMSAAFLLTMPLCQAAVTPLVTVPFEFAHMSDQGYSPPDIIKLNDMLHVISADPTINFVLHTGDLGAPLCTTESKQAQFTQLNSVFQPLIVTPGDNDWANCDDPIGQLTSFRQIFYYNLMKNPKSAVSTSLGQNKLTLKSQNGQQGLVENQSWVYNNIMFATLHIVGDGDGCELSDPVTGDVIGTTNNIPSSCSPEKLQRQISDIKWLKAVFSSAKEMNLNGIVLGVQMLQYGNGKVNLDGSCVDQNDMECKIHEPYRIALNAELKAYSKPVALLYGDEHIFRVDYPYPDTYPNFVNAEALGSPDIGYTRVKVDPNDPKLFSFSKGYCLPRLGSVNCDPSLAGKVNVIGHSTVAMLTNADSCGTPNGRRCESLVGDVVSDAARSVVGTDFGFHNSGGIRGGLTCTFPHDLIQGQPCPKEDFEVFPYQITDGKVLLALPFSTNIVTKFTMSGLELKAWLENGVSIMPTANGRFPQVSGLCFQYDIAQPVGSRIISSSVVRQAADGTCTGAPIDLTSSNTSQYSMVTIDFLSNGGDGYPIIPAARQTLLDKPMQDIVQLYLVAVGTISPKIQGRILCLDSNGATAPNCPVTLP